MRSEELGSLRTWKLGGERGSFRSLLEELAMLSTGKAVLPSQPNSKLLRIKAQPTTLQSQAFTLLKVSPQPARFYCKPSGYNELRQQEAGKFGSTNMLRQNGPGNSG